MEALEQSRVKSKVSTENHYSPVYVGDLNVTEGKPFRIVCHAKPPIAWFKDGERIQIHKVRHGRENFTYTVKDLMLLDDPKGKVESTLTVSKADLSHRGKYQCNINFESSFFLQVYPIPQVIDEEQKFTSSLESEYDHEEERIKFETTFDDDRAMPSTMLRFTTPTVTQSSGYYEPAPDYEFREKDNSDERVSRYETENEVIAEENFETNNLPQENFEIQTDQLDIIEEVLPTVSSSPAITSLTKIPFHPTHATTHSNQVVHTTHAIPSEVQIQYHPDKHRHKGSQKMKKKNDSKKFFL